MSRKTLNKELSNRWQCPDCGTFNSADDAECECGTVYDGPIVPDSLMQEAMTPEIMPKEAAPQAPAGITAAELTAQYKTAVAGALEMLRFGAMLIEVDSCLTRETAHSGQRNQYTGGSLKSWLEENCPEINYKTAMRFKQLATDMREYCRLPAKLPVTLALPGPGGETHTDDLPENVNKERAVKFQQQIWEMVQGTSARQLMFKFAENHKPRGGDHGGGKAYSEKYASPNEMRKVHALKLWPELRKNIRDFFIVKKYHVYFNSTEKQNAIASLKDCIAALKLLGD